MLTTLCTLTREKEPPEGALSVPKNREGALSCRCKQLNLFSGVFVHASFSTPAARNGKNKTKQQQQATLLTLHEARSLHARSHVEEKTPFHVQRRLVT